MSPATGTMRAGSAVTRNGAAASQREEDGERDDLFRPFRRGSGAAPGGAGLGLAIVDRVQRAHGGVVERRPRPRGGSLFTLTYRVATS